MSSDVGTGTEVRVCECVSRILSVHIAMTRDSVGHVVTQLTRAYQRGQHTAGVG